MSRQSPFTRLCSNFGQQRKLFLLVFLWTCLCLFLFRSTLFMNSADDNLQESSEVGQKLHARSLPARSSMAPLYAAPEFALPDQNNPSALYYSLASISAGAKSSSPSSASSSQPTVDESQKTSSEQQVAGAECQYQYPSLFNLQFNNIHWQKMSAKESANSTASYYLYNAYYDDRWRAGQPSVRVLAMIDRIQPPPTNCLLWSATLNRSQSPLVSRASFVYAWYPKWGNYKDGFLQPWIVTCPVPRSHPKLVPDSVSLVAVPPPKRAKRSSSSLANSLAEQSASIAMPPSFSSSLPSVAEPAEPQRQHQRKSPSELSLDCQATLPITNNLPVFNQRPAVKQRFAVCVKGLDFPHEDVSVRLVEWIELLNLLGAGKIFLYELDVHENISKVLDYYQKRGMVELSPLTLPGDQPNLPEYQHLYLKSKLTAKRQNELIPYNDCLYRNLNSYQYLALLDIDEIIMPLKHHNWIDLMDQVESWSLAEQNYSRASYNVRNVYFFDDLAGPLGTTSAKPGPQQSDNEDPSPAPLGVDWAELEAGERGIPPYLHMMQHVYRSKNYTKPGQYVKCFHNTDRVVSLHNHFPMNCFGQCTTYSIPVHLAHLQHYRKDCVGPLKQSCKSDFRVFTQRDTTIWKYKQQMIRRTTRVLNHLGLLAS